MLKPGDPAPDFAVGGTTLHSLLARGPAVVFFYPKAFTPTCTVEAAEFRDRHAELARSGASVVGVSSDSQEKAEAFRASLDLPFPLVGDPGGAILRAYGVRWPLVGWARRVTYVIGRDGKVRDAHHSERAGRQHVTQACSQVKKEPPA
jgi:thioredoxin-dependent peroxiredoxin